MTAEFRIDQETGDWRIVAPERARRPVDRSPVGARRCPFCPGNEASTPPELLRVPAGARDWRVRVVPNRFALVSPDGAPPAAGERPRPAGPTFPATGHHEIVVESPRHDGEPRFATSAQTLEVLWVLRERCRTLARRKPAAIVVFRNHGADAGMSLRHPHSQIVALDHAPPGLVNRWRTARTVRSETGRCRYDAVALDERADGRRVVADADGVLVFQPRAAGVPHETVLLPSDAAPDLAGASDDALEAVARALPLVLAGLAAVRDDPAYNLVVHAGPTGDDSARDWYRWHVGLYPRVTRRGGLEIAAGLGVNPTSPEETAPLLRRAVAEAANWQRE